MTNTLVNYSKTNRSISWQWYAEKVSRNAAGEQGFVPRLERYGFCYRTTIQDVSEKFNPPSFKVLQELVRFESIRRMPSESTNYRLFNDSLYS